MNHRAEEPVARYLAALEPPLLRNFDLLAGAPKGVARLRQLILSLAVRGKLVPQDPNDEPASVLLERIRLEKARLVAEGKIRQEKPLATISEAEKPFGLPAGWEWVRFGSISINRDGERIPVSSEARENREKLYDYYGASGVIDKIDGFLFEETLLLIGEDGANLINRATPIAFLASGKYWVNNHAHVVDAADHTLLNYLCLFINAISLEPYITGTAQPKMNQAKLNSIPVTLPPLAEQSRIVTRVDALMRLCDELEAKGRLEAEQHARLVGTLFETLAASESAHALAENWQRIAAHFDLLLDRPEAVDPLEQTLLQLAVRGLLVPQDPADEPASALLEKIRAEKHRLIAAGKLKRDKPLPPVTEDEKPFELPAGWEWVRFGEVALIASNLVSPSLHGNLPQVAPDSIEKGTGRLIEMRSVKEAGVTSPNHRFRAGQILYSKIRPSLSKAVVVDFDGLCSADMYPVNSLIDTDYLHRYILSQPFLEQVKVAENRVKMPKLNQEALNSFLVPVPPLPEQSRIIARVEQLRRLCADLRARLGEARDTQSRLAETLVDTSTV
jgi:type I restriction enzyme S subunit